MTVFSTIASSELQMLLEEKYVDNYFEACLLNAPGYTYDPATENDATVISSHEVAAGTAGYRRQVIGYSPTDITVYSEQGMGLTTKVAIFVHDGSGTSLDFTHVALQRGSGNILTLATNIAEPNVGIPGTYENIPTVTDGNGIGATVNVTVESNGTDFTVSMANPGYGYAPANSLSVTDADLTTAGAIEAGAGGLNLDINTVTGADEHAGQLLSVAGVTAPVSLTGGNEAIFYFNLKQFGYSS